MVIYLGKMDSEPPPMLNNDNDSSGDELFGGAGGAKTATVVAPSTVAAAVTESSGYATDNVHRSDTMEDVKVEDDDDDDLFKSARGLEPEPAKVRGDAGGDVDGQRGGGGGEVIDLMEDEEENPFQDPQLQLSSATSATSAAAAVTTSTRPGILSASASAVTNDAAMPAPPTVKESHAPSAAPTSAPVRSSILDGMDSDEKKEAAGGDDFVDINVSNPRKVGGGMSSYVVYTVTSRTNMTLFKRPESTVTRRFSDFLGLHDKLSDKYLQNGRVIPPAPDKSVVNMTKVKMGGGKDGGTSSPEPDHDQSAAPDEFLERRRHALERFLNRTAAHPSLRTDPDFREFLELDSELPKASQTASLSAKNVVKFISKVGERVTNMTIKMEETDEWFEEKSEVMDQLDHQLRRLHSSTEALFEYRRALANSTGSLSRALAALSSAETDTELSGALSKLSVVQEKMEKVHSDQATADFYQLSEMVKDYVGLVGAVKDVFQERVKAWQQWQNATATLTKKREAKAKAELAGKADRVGQLRQEIAEQERQQEMAQDNFDRVSRMVKKEVEMFDVRRAEEFKSGVVAYLEAMLRAQEDVAGTWERYLPEIQQINHKH